MDSHTAVIFLQNVYEETVISFSEEKVISIPRRSKLKISFPCASLFGVRTKLPKLFPC